MTRISTYELLEKLYGVRTTTQINDLVDSVPNSITKILRNNPMRTSILIVNNGVTALYVSFLPDVSSSKGIYIGPAGGSVVFQWDNDFTLATKEMYAISVGGPNNVYIQESIIQ